MHWTLRRAVRDDLPRVQVLFADMMRAIDPNKPTTGYAPQDVAYYFSGGDDWICVAETDGEVVGFLAMEVHREDVEYIYLDDLSVSPEFRGKGIGTALLREADVYARQKHIPLIVLHVEATNTSAQKLYKRRGFTIMDQPDSRFRMIKKLNT